MKKYSAASKNPDAAKTEKNEGRKEASTSGATTPGINKQLQEVGTTQLALSIAAQLEKALSSDKSQHVLLEQLTTLLNNKKDEVPSKVPEAEKVKDRKMKGQKSSSKNEEAEHKDNVESEMADALENLNVKIEDDLHPQKQSFSKIPKVQVYKLIHQFMESYPGMFTEDQLFKKIQNRVRNERCKAKRTDDSEKQAIYLENARKRMEKLRAEKAAKKQSKEPDSSKKTRRNEKPAKNQDKAKTNNEAEGSGGGPVKNGATQEAEGSNSTEAKAKEHAGSQRTQTDTEEGEDDEDASSTERQVVLTESQCEQRELEWEQQRQRERAEEARRKELHNDPDFHPSDVDVEEEDKVEQRRKKRKDSKGDNKRKASLSTTSKGGVQPAAKKIAEKSEGKEGDSKKKANMSTTLKEDDQQAAKEVPTPEKEDGQKSEGQEVEAKKKGATSGSLTEESQQQEKRPPEAAAKGKAKEKGATSATSGKDVIQPPKESERETERPQTAAATPEGKAANGATSPSLQKEKIEPPKTIPTKESVQPAEGSEKAATTAQGEVKNGATSPGSQKENIEPPKTIPTKESVQPAAGSEKAATTAQANVPLTENPNINEENDKAASPRIFPERTNRGQTSKYEDYEANKEKKMTGKKRVMGDAEDQRDEPPALDVGCRVAIHVGKQAVGTALVMLVEPTDTFGNQPVGDGKLGIILQTVFPDAANVSVPKKFTRMPKSRKLKVQDLPLNQLIDWPEDSVKVMAARKKSRKS